MYGSCVEACERMSHRKKKGKNVERVNESVSGNHSIIGDIEQKRRENVSHTVVLDVMQFGCSWLLVRCAEEHCVAIREEWFGE